MLAAPLTAVVFVAMAGYSLASMRFGGNEAYLLEVKVAIEALPERIGAFRGVDRPVQEAAQQLLRPNKLLQREYVHDFTGETFSLLIVHCADVRDMMGHYPPKCYPSSGWDLDGKSEDQIERSAGSPIPITRYLVSRGDGTVEYARVIANTFVVPRADDPLGSDDRILDEVTRSRWSSGLGAAQVQIITDAKMDPATRAEIERSVADRLEGLIGAVSMVREGEGEDP
jgi:hypothetical protein